jgi:uncharacterized LabA/DUF88 family protein
MVLNIFPRKKEAAPAVAVEPPLELPEPSPEALDEPPRRPARRGTRGGRGRSRPAPDGLAPDASLAAAEPETPPEAAPDEAAPAAPRRRRSRKTEAAVDEAVTEAAVAEVAVAETKPPPQRPSRRAAPRPAPEPEPPARADAPAESASILRALEQQKRQIDRLIQLQEEASRRDATSVGAPPARVGVFVDAANIELACDRLRARLDWAKILALLTENRQLVRAIAYSPVHDDPNVSIETQRFVEPFLDKGFKVVTKALKRFQDGTVKANVDIEMALDILSMLERLDVVCLVSGDGDFQRLVELIQSRGIRVEVVSIGMSTASNLRHAADHFIDLHARLREVRL